MRILMGAAIVALLMAAPASAQTDAASQASDVQSACGAITAPPSLPDGANATREQMSAANNAYTEWFTANRDALNCRRAEVEQAQARWESLRDAYNAGAEMVNTTNTSWQAEIEEFNAGSGQQRSRSRTVVRP